MPAVQVILECSLPCKTAEAGVHKLSLWGKLITRNAKVHLKTCFAADLLEILGTLANSPYA